MVTCELISYARYVESKLFTISTQKHHNTTQKCWYQPQISDYLVKSLQYQLVKTKWRISPFLILSQHIGLWPMYYFMTSKECNNYITYRQPQKYNPQKYTVVKCEVSCADSTMHDLSGYKGWCDSHRFTTIQRMMTSSQGRFFCITSPLCGEFIGHQWIPLTKGQ